MSWHGREVRLAARPRGAPTADDFDVVDVEIGEPSDGEVVIRAEYLSVDPYLRLYLNEIRSNGLLFALGARVPAFMVGRVVASRHPTFSEGEWVTGRLGWAEVLRSDGSGLVRFDARLGPPSAAIGVLGMPGFTAWCGITQVGRPRDGETVYVSAAAGAVGSIAGQLARSRGARVLGSAGSAAKVDLLRELGFDAAFDYRTAPVGESLARLAPDGLDVCFDNVGGGHLEAAIAAMRDFGRVVACGAISQYNREDASPGPRNLHLLFMRSITIRGFRNGDFGELRPTFEAEMSEALRTGTVRLQESIVEGIECVPETFASVFDSPPPGKVLVRVGPGA